MCWKLSADPPPMKKGSVFTSASLLSAPISESMQLCGEMNKSATGEPFEIAGFIFKVYCFYSILKLLFFFRTLITMTKVY